VTVNFTCERVQTPVAIIMAVRHPIDSLLEKLLSLLLFCLPVILKT